MTLLVSREDWGSVFDYTARHDTHPAPPWKDETCLHHSDTIAPDELIPWDDEYAAMRLLERIGADRFGSGMSYNVAVMPSGNAYAGQPLDNKATHSGYADWNYTRASIVFVGNYATTRPTKAALRKVAEIQFVWLQAGLIKSAGLTWHGRVQSTACPGRYVIEKVPDIERMTLAMEVDVPLFESKAEFRNEVRTAVQGEIEEQRPAIVGEVVAALVPYLPANIDLPALVDQIAARMPPATDTAALVEEIAGRMPTPLDVPALLAQIGEVTKHPYAITKTETYEAVPQ